MSTSPALLAYEVYAQTGEQGCFVFAASHEAAITQGAAELDIAVDTIECALRMPEFDRYAPGPVPLAALLEQGCEFVCPTCGQTISSGARDKKGQPLQPVISGDEVYCCAAHAPAAQA
ncbi:hypothetical protein [Plasticicumulans acidivorans]|uniref:Uncharacterized protein n=1 Tax=Plasticicumulans acidivorans TaxID=886464 RepID=A0A317MX35_9GAMM|nr:hypothetical protein [Plasticicumulans acidivorans]PWV63177.1 hypothetical protein C7443_103102 [Plasticicumulans acidivorans]